MAEPRPGRDADDSGAEDTGDEATTGAGKTNTGLRLTLSIWHPNCWTLEVTEGKDGGLLGHGVYTAGDKATGRFTVYAPSTEAVENLIEEIRASERIDRVWTLGHEFQYDSAMPTPGNTARGLLVEYSAHDSINDPLVNSGFYPDQPVRMTDGREYWTVVTYNPREEISERLDTVRRVRNAEVEVVRMTAEDEREAGSLFPMDVFTEKQRQILRLAIEEGYYTWPRETSVSELAEIMGVSEPTVLDHLRKAESKLINALFSGDWEEY
ncbi:MAG TPA: helix-turn-helix domain-containing protein [Natrialbaceae archaeon]|nr:helix-turn-helix domain-containing protein [Natrialbaceae archaeon]